MFSLHNTADGNARTLTFSLASFSRMHVKMQISWMETQLMVDLVIHRLLPFVGISQWLRKHI